MFWKQPLNNRDWSRDQALLPHITFVDHNVVRIEHIRDIVYQTETEYTLRHYDREYDLSTVTEVRIAISPFWKYQAAHTFFVFYFANGTSLAVSIEIRKKKGEKFSGKSFIPGYFEIMYVIADPRDVISLRVDVWKDPLYLYPLALTPHTTHRFITDILRYAQRLEHHPLFYHPLWRSCGINMMRHLRRSGVKLPHISWRYALPASLDELLVRYGLIDWAGSIESLRNKYRVNNT